MKRDYLIKLRKDREWTQADVATILGISTKLYNMFETGKRTPRLYMALKIQELFGEPLDKIFYDLKPNSTLLDDIDIVTDCNTGAQDNVL